MAFHFGKITRTYRQILRYREIAGVLFKHGFSDVVTTLGLKRYVPWRWRRRQKAERVPTLSHYERIRLALEELGPTFIKFGQVLSMRRDILPEGLLKELEKLQDRVPPFPSDEARRVVEEELQQPLTGVFASFDDEPTASASIAQVHHGVLVTGEEVAVKIRRPRIQSMIEMDIGILSHLAALTERLIEGAQVFEPQRIVSHFARMIRKELDFPLEASNMQQFARNFEHDSRLYVPAVYGQFSTERMLTMEYVRGVKISDLESFSVQGLEAKVVADNGAELVLTQVFKHGFFHADPHPGNILIMPDNVLCLLDYGTMGALTERYQENLSKLFIGFAERDERQVTNVVFQIAGYSSQAKSEDLENDIAIFMQDQLYRPLAQIEVGQVLSGLSRLLIRHDIHLPATYFLLIKCLTTLEGIGRNLAPDFDLLEYIKPFARRLMRERIGVRSTMRDLYMGALEARSLLRDMPAEFRQLLGLFKHRDLGFKLEHTGLEGLKQTHDQVSNRIVFAMVLAALIVGSSIMVLSNVPPKWNEIPVIGLAGFVVSGLMGFGLLASILRHGKM